MIAFAKLWRVSAAEWTAVTSRRFSQIDLDHDGKLTLATLPPLPGAGPAPSRPSLGGRTTTAPPPVGGLPNGNSPPGGM